jgi:hypothetical protein
MKFIYFPDPDVTVYAGPLRAEVHWYASMGGEGRYDYHASIDGVRPVCPRSATFRKDPRVNPPTDPSRDPWACPVCQELVRRVPEKKHTSVRILNRALARALLGVI